MYWKMRFFYYGLENGHEKKAMRVWIEFCELFNPKYVADIGANTGIYGLVAKALDSNCNVAFFEPLESAHIQNRICFGN